MVIAVRKTSSGQIAFALVMIGVGLQGLPAGGFGAIWTPVPKYVPAREAAYVCDFVCLLGGIGLLLRSALAARLLWAVLLVWYLAMRLPVIVHAPLSVLSWEGSSETLAVVTGAWVLYARFATDWDRRHLRLAVGDSGLRIARFLYGISLIAFGVAHFAFVKFTAGFIAAWIPAHTFWVWFTGGAYVAAGIALATGVWERTAAALAALQIAGFTVLVWLPRLAAGARDAGTISEATVSVALTAAALVMAQSWRTAR